MRTAKYGLLHINRRLTRRCTGGRAEQRHVTLLAPYWRAPDLARLGPAGGVGGKNAARGPGIVSYESAQESPMKKLMRVLLSVLLSVTAAWSQAALIT